MTSLGEILLKFGATGANGEEPLRFKTAHINLLVGPNNAGKSLMLRELSGVDPRGDRGYGLGAKHRQKHIVEAVEWAADVARSLQQQVLSEVFAANDPAWVELRSKSWEQLLPALENAAREFTAIRDRLCSTLFEIFGAYLADWKGLAWDFFRSDLKGFAKLAIGGAIVALQMTRINAGLVAAASSDPASSLAPRRVGPLTPEQAVAMLQALEEAWGRCDAVFSTLGIDIKEISIANLLDTNGLGGTLLAELAKNPILNQLISIEPGLPRLEMPSVATLEQTRRFISFAGWLIDPEPMERLARLLQEAYRQVSWENQSRRDQLAREVLYLDGMARLEVTSSAKLKAFERHGNDQPVILSFLKSADLRERLRALTVDALDAYLVVDMTTHAPQIVWRLAQTPPPVGLECTYADDTNRFHHAAALLEDRSDGIHAFVGMLAAILANATDLVFIDEPEAFLHPPLVRQLARQLSVLARDTGIQFFIATHSADLLEAFVSGGSEVNIIRLTHDSERSTARLLDSTSLRYLARDPLLRSESTLSALFHEGAVICEAAGDRVLYKEINERLLAADEDAMDSCVFLNAQNWGTVPRMMTPLRKMGVAAAALLDADVLFEPGLTNVLVAAQVDKVIRDGWLKVRDGLRDQIIKRIGPAFIAGAEDDEEEEQEGKAKKLQLKGKTIALLIGSEKEAFAELRASMARYGVFIVPVGELEDWLAPLGLRPPAKNAHKARWLRGALDRLGQDPQLEGYVRPEKGDIWDFMRSVNEWIRNPERKGTSPMPHQDA